MNHGLIFSLVVTMTSSSPGGLDVAKTEKKHNLTATLVISTPVIRIGEQPKAEFHLKNVSKEPVTILYRAPFFRSLDIEVLDPGGKKISTWKYGWLFGPNNQEKTATLQPGETVRCPVNLFAIWPEADQKKPGTYKCKAIFDTEKGVRVVSETVEIKLTEK